MFYLVGLVIIGVCIGRLLRPSPAAPSGTRGEQASPVLAGLLLHTGAAELGFVLAVLAPTAICASAPLARACALKIKHIRVKDARCA